MLVGHCIILTCFVCECVVAVTPCIALVNTVSDINFNSATNVLKNTRLQKCDQFARAIFVSIIMGGGQSTETGSI